MRALFGGFVFVVGNDVPQEVLSLVVACGGRVCRELTAATTHGLVVGPECGDSIDVEQLRGLRIPILRTHWIRACVAALRILPMKGAAAAFDPFLFDSLLFTTTMMRCDLKDRVAALIIFLGGSYSPHLTISTDVVLVGDDAVESISGSDCVVDVSLVDKSHRGPAKPLGAANAGVKRGVRSSKLKLAASRSIPCVNLVWLQKCISTGQVHLPVTGGL
ncbi:hypothetical protein, conserved [Trypanosoma brucei brucei TREU927]|uniref:BRCT domain-containing protein n=1 Tax=Trypanosoma brucei brucei (strain 927/4 GUTat10.1) TaxID=185431 RepID=Q38AT0_TRYB2|nr:hypothetical protein, conserved [Trypanosoma brucei brucei TREU927]EAN78090.1 hypothetical protein, conserved [Trypanosoma brucei brucei TREU927]